MIFLGFRGVFWQRSAEGAPLGRQRGPCGRGPCGTVHRIGQSRGVGALRPRLVSTRPCRV